MRTRRQSRSRSTTPAKASPGRPRSKSKNKPAKASGSSSKPEAAPKRSRSKSPAASKKPRATKKEVNVVSSAASAIKAAVAPVASRTSRQMARLNPKTSTKHQDFGGPIGAHALIILLPLIVLVLAYGCDKKGYHPLERTVNFVRGFFASHVKRHYVRDALTHLNCASFLWYGAFLVNLAGLSAFLPGDEVQGPRLRDGTKLTYTLNALTVLQTIVTLGILLVKNQGLHAPLWIADHDAHLAVASILAAAIVAGITYACSFHGQKLLSVSGNTGCPPYDWAVGRELTPRIGSFDLKLFAVRPGLIGWFVLIASYLLKQYHDLGHITNSMALVVGFQTLYIVDALWYETELLNSLAITHDGFGFIQAVVHFSWVPCVHSLQARYLADFPVTLPLWKAGLVAALNLGGYYMYRCRKPKKQQGGRRGSTTDLSPGCIFAKYGKATGDLMMSLSWSLACGCASAVPYFFVAYRAIALAYQEYRRVQHT